MLFNLLLGHTLLPMKKNLPHGLLLTLGLALGMATSVPAYAQKGKDVPPAAVLQHFGLAFPQAQKVRWELESDGKYEAEFILAETEIDVTYTPDGTLLETEQEIEASELPPAVATALLNDYPKARPREYAKITRADKSEVYEIEMKLNGKATDVLYLPNGQKVE